LYIIRFAIIFNLGVVEGYFVSDTV
jgi:hypothetical protein